MPDDFGDGRPNRRCLVKHALSEVGDDVINRLSVSVLYDITLWERKWETILVLKLEQLAFAFVFEQQIVHASSGRTQLE